VLGSGPLLRRTGKKVDLTVQNGREIRLRLWFHGRCKLSLLVLPPSLFFLCLSRCCLCLQFISGLFVHDHRPLIYTHFLPFPSPPPILWGHTSRYRTNPNEPRVAVNAKQKVTIKSTPLGLGLGLWELSLFDSFYASFPRKIYRRLLHQEIWGVDKGKDDFAG